jgi:LmbE family N-acetylglucosaminyl deacetylase
MNSPSTGSVLVIAAHPDDEVLGVGATMARLVCEGRRVSVLIVSEGVGLRHAGSTLDSIRETARAANRMLGVEEVRFGGLNTGGELLDERPNRFVVALIADHLAELRPQTVFTHHADDIHIDHQVLARATRYCLRPSACPSLRRVLAYEVLSSTEAASAACRRFEPSVFYDVDAFLQRKIQAMQCYPTEMLPYPHPRSPEAIEALAKTRGVAAGFRSAEAFHLIREVL